MHTFQDKVLNATKQIPRGKVITYRALGKKLHTKAYRAIGQALKHNPDAPRIPCHRVIKSDGSLGGYCGKMNSSKKKQLLRKEGVEVKNNRIEKRFIVQKL